VCVTAIGKPLGSPCMRNRRMSSPGSRVIVVPVRAVEAVVLVFERNACRAGGDQAAVGDGDAMSVLGQLCRAHYRSTQPTNKLTLFSLTH